MVEAALQQFAWEAGPAAPVQLGAGICNRLAQLAGMVPTEDLSSMGRVSRLCNAMKP